VHDLTTLYDSQPSHFEGFTQIVLPGECEFFSHFYWRGKSTWQDISKLIFRYLR